jgi:ribonuclease P protein component
VLPSTARLRRSRDFSETVRHGARAGRPLLVVHLDPGTDVTAPRSRPGHDPRAGFVVSKAVGNSVVRHAVVRRLRHLVGPRLAALPPGSRLVVRALPASARATSGELAADLDAALERAVRHPRQQPRPTVTAVTS